ncbi:GNAT family N-acetyltransferase [Tenacibaculum piscium]|uniref:Acetyltransferase n=2 Tax=Tenacibaculum piscium TaxID=1458515 RepID=A0A2H1YF15_9FLAO|nr:GNAT family N-acetyltransferase [Tenacibaculum piscium]MBE7628365.1 GNAT family N-acetyltransferase [Tenacibaculum piscium]MBE7669522.1 GNAT family N-acetyltransferase [Tenacibaculum piscium]MBE7686327.1 GNAT family N-acetyltransferase [Tenacibaculum piscium]MBE7689520.1 GNAT family N-acetyltransferase [Tenacibaculum piscium]SOS73971.1 Acetyltransferase [Tenacibaculum piscium]
MNINFRIIPTKEILTILPLLKKANTKTPHDILKERVLEMANYPTYECIGLFDADLLIGITGLWYSTRHYIGKSVEPDHVFIDETYRGKNLGKQFFNWIYDYTKQKGCEVMELNTYTGNRKSHKFYYNEGFEIYGFHFIKVMRENQKFY